MFERPALAWHTGCIVAAWWGRSADRVSFMLDLFRFAFDMARLRGVTYREVPYFLFLAAIDRSTGLAEHQVVQTDRNEFTIGIAPLPGRSIAAEQINRFVRESVAAEDLADALKWNVEVVPEIEPSPQSGKIQRVKTLVGPPEGIGDERDRAGLHLAGFTRDH